MIIAEQERRHLVGGPRASCPPLTRLLPQAVPYQPRSAGILSAVRGHPAHALTRSLPLPVLKLRIKLRRLVFRHTQRLPVTRSEMLREKNDLSDVIGIMRELSINCLHYRVILPANPDRAHQ